MKLEQYNFGICVRSVIFARMKIIEKYHHIIALPALALWHGVLIILCFVAMAAHFLLSSYADVPLQLVIVFGGMPLLIPMMRKIIKGDFGADFLGGIELIAAALLEQYLAAVLIVLMLSGGQTLEAYAMRKASSALRALSDRMPASAHRKKDGKVEKIALSDIAIGDEIVVLPHETAPVDGVVCDGSGMMDESYLTGEPYQVAKTVGASVMSGAINGDAVLTIRAEKLAQDSRYAQIMEVMAEAEQKRPQLRRLGDQIGGYFAFFALAFAVAVWLMTGDALRFLAVLVVATPCPLIIAIPVTIMGAVSLAARCGIIIKDPSVLELLPTCRTAIFDKTGTLTYGKPELTDVVPVKGMDKNTVLQLVASLEHYSKHPLASAIVAAAKKAGLSAIEAQSVSEKAGQGLTGMVSGREVHVTSRKKLLASRPDIENVLPPTEAGLECLVMLDGTYAATLRFRDAPRSDGRSFIGHLAPAHQFSKVMLVSGDRNSEVSYLAKMLGIAETFASQSPEQKVAIVRAETAKTPTLFMGDGINDAPALASATVGIAFGQHSSVTAEAAGAVIMENTLVKVDELLHISMKLRKIALQSAIGGIMFSLVGMVFAATGHISPVFGAVMQEVIDVLAILNALRLSIGSSVKTDLMEK